MLARRMLAAAGLSPLPLLALVAAGFLVGIGGHVYGSRTAIATGIGLIFLGVLALPFGVYLGDR
jgi:hypothetical protein